MHVSPRSGRALSAIAAYERTVISDDAPLDRYLRGDETALTEAQLRGKALFEGKANCIACHNGDPSLDGSLGPAVAGASEELLYARVIAGTYPPGYEPARPESGVMPQFEYLEPEIPALAAYLAEVTQAAQADGESGAGSGS